MRQVLLDVTDLVEFLQRQESASGVQRVVAEVTPLILQRDRAAQAVILDRSRGVFVALSPSEQEVLIDQGARATTARSRGEVAAVATSAIRRAHAAAAISIGPETVLVFLGALWINDALMMASRNAHLSGASVVSLLYDLTPVMEAGHTAAVNRLFDRYLTLLIDTASRVPAISSSSRRDFETYARERGSAAPDGNATGLPCGLTPAGRNLDESPWPRPYALFVGTIEARKNHIVAWEAWRRLIERRGATNVPDLVCIGRLGWHASEFLREYVMTKGLGGKVSVLTDSVADEDLARFYAYCEFTVYPSRYEGWGLPVSESLAFGKVPVVADNSSLREAGGDLAVYVPTNDVDALASVIEHDLLDPRKRSHLEHAIEENPPSPVTWEDVADTITREIDQAQWRTPVFPQVELGREYVLSVPQPAPDAGYADQFLDYLTREGLTPLLRQPRGEHDVATIDAAVIGTFGSPQTWGYEIRPGHHAEFRFTRPTDGDLVLLVATRSMPGRASIEASGPGGPVFEDIYLGSVLTLPLAHGKAGEPAQVRLSVTDASDSIEGFLGIRSFVVLRADDPQARITALESAADALRQELDFMTGTRSWKLTAPLRKWKGRGA